MGIWTAIVALFSSAVWQALVDAIVAFFSGAVGAAS